jgi:hypothetical protein
MTDRDLADPVRIVLHTHDPDQFGSGSVGSVHAAHRDDEQTP